MAEREKRLNLKALSRAFGVSSVTVRSWLDKGLPNKRTSQGYTFDLSEAIQWREKYLQEAKKGNNDAFEAAKTEKEIYRAKMAKLNYERMDGSLVPVEAVREQAFATARLVRDQLMNIPSRLSPILAAEHDAKKVHELMDKEIRQCLENLCSELKQSEVTNGEKN